VPITARWVEPEQRKGTLTAYAKDAEALTLRLLDEAIRAEGARPLPEQVQEKLRAAAPRDIEELLPQLEPRADELAREAEAKLLERGIAEEKSLRDTLERQRGASRATRSRSTRRKVASSRSASTRRDAPARMPT
jgi:hypothetical protein